MINSEIRYFILRLTEFIYNLFVIFGLVKNMKKWMCIKFREL